MVANFIHSKLLLITHFNYQNSYFKVNMIGIKDSKDLIFAKDIHVLNYKVDKILKFLKNLIFQDFHPDLSYVLQQLLITNFLYNKYH